MSRRQSAPLPGSQQLLEQLRGLAKESHRQSMARLGVPIDSALGVPTTTLRKLAKTLEPDLKLARSLWESGLHEARLLAVLVSPVAEVTPAAAERWLREVVSWDLCDHLCNNLLRHIPVCRERLESWARDPGEFVRRAAFSTIACLSIHEPDMPGSELQRHLELIQAHASDSSSYVKKALSWALRESGKMGPEAHEKALAVARELARSTHPSARWVEVCWRTFGVALDLVNLLEGAHHLQSAIDRGQVRRGGAGRLPSAPAQRAAPMAPPSSTAEAPSRAASSVGPSKDSHSGFRLKRNKTFEASLGNLLLLSRRHAHAQHPLLRRYLQSRLSPSFTTSMMAWVCAWLVTVCHCGFVGVAPALEAARATSP